MIYIDSKELREKGSIALLQGGAVLKTVDDEVIKVLDDIENIATDPKAKRRITLQFTITSTPSRSSINLDVQAKTDLAPKAVLNMSLDLERAIDDNGHLLSYQLREQCAEADGQQTIDDEEVHRDVISLPYKGNAIDAEFSEKSNEESAQSAESDDVVNTSDDEETPSEELESADMEEPYMEPHFSEGSQDAF